jgi:predicted permease
LLGLDPGADVDEELRFHLDARQEDLMSRGLPPEAASSEAARQFGDVDAVRQMCIHIEKGRVRRMDWQDWLAGCGQDLVYATRQLGRHPAFTLTALLSLALGIGANTAIFTLSDQILLRLLPVERPRELAQLRVDGGHVGSQSGDGIHTFSLPTYLALRDGNTVFSGLTGMALESAGLEAGGRNDLLNIAMVAGNYFEVFGVKPFAGRLLTADDDRVKLGGPVAVLRYEFWQSRFGASPSAVGSKIRLNGYPFTVIGVAAPGFEGTNVGFPNNIWIPVTMKPAINPTDTAIDDERYSWFYLFGRLKPGVSLAKAEAAMKVTYRQRQQEELQMNYFRKYPDDRQRFLKQNFKLEPAERGQSVLRERFERPLIILQWVVGAILLIACCNIAGLLLARSASRQREMAIRGAMGAGRARLIRQLLVESLLLVCASGTAGILVSLGATRALLRLLTSDPSQLSLQTSPDLRIMVFALALTLMTTMLVSLLPAVHSSRPAADALKESAGAIAGGRSHARLRKVFVGFQVGLSTLLLIMAGLFARTLGNLRTIDLGFQTTNVATLTVLPVTEYSDAHKLQVFRSLIENLATTPGVKAVGANTTPLLAGGRSDGPIRLPENVKGENAPQSFFNSITPGYFEALGIPIKAGRNLSWKDWGSGRRYCLVNETLVDDYLAGRNPVGTMLGRGADTPLDYEVIGVFANARYHDPRGQIPRQTFFSLDSRIHFASAINIFARIQGDPRVVLPQLREQVRRVDPNLLITNTGTLEDQLNRRLANERLLAMLSETFAFLAVVLAATGLYGVLSFLVARRHREIGIRVALGARRGRVVRMVLSEMTATFLSGVFAGTAAAFLCGRLVETQLYGVKPFDSRVFLTGIAALSLCALLAVALPAWRALRLDPATVLRHE